MDQLDQFIINALNIISPLFSSILQFCLLRNLISQRSILYNQLTIGILKYERY